VLTQYNSHRLLEHLQFGWTFLPGRLGEYIHVWPAQQSLDKDVWYSGTADAIYQNLSNIQAFAPENVMILAGDHVYKMDYKYFLEDHLNANADLTIACLEVPRLSATGFGVAGVDQDDRIVSWVEKSPDPPGLPGNPDMTLASMGIYLFRASFLKEVLERDASDRDSGHDFGKDLIPYLVPRSRVFVHRFEKSCVRNPLRPESYWRDVGTVDAYWEANLDLTYAIPALNLYEADWPIYSYIEPLPSAKFVHSDPHRQGVAINSLVSAGCIVSGANVRQSVLFTNSRVHSHARLEETLVLPNADIGEHARLRRAVVAPGVQIPQHLVVGEDPEADAARFYRTASGVTLISQRMLDQP
jgi:glucose-1-phosphate adenylyltransferase